ncbi:hypothetical protein BTA51_00935 [Hahella sp. CCB-MM4]|nr:hypothetical protein BTA51_00935 [Hahella sp. CCB-MM4]
MGIAMAVAREVGSRIVLIMSFDMRYKPLVVVLVVHTFDARGLFQIPCLLVEISIQLKIKGKCYFFWML